MTGRHARLAWPRLAAGAGIRLPRLRRSPPTSSPISPGPATSCRTSTRASSPPIPTASSISIFGDDDDAFTKVKAGFRPDIAHPCYDKVARWNKEGLLQPIDTKRIKNWDTIFPVFRNLPDIQAGDGKVWMVPWDWGNTSILYRTDLVKNPEQSWNLLWDKRICRPHGDHRCRPRHAGRRRAARRRQPVRHDAGRDGQGRRQAARAAPAAAQLHHRHDLGRAGAGRAASWSRR